MQHFTNERFNYTVRLSNGRIEIPSSMALDEERMPSSITEDRIQNVANSFQNNNPKPQTNVLENVSLNEVEEDVKTVIPKLSLWQKLLRLLGLK
ncbi:MAG: hypothetical protein CUR32_00025 [Flavobacterium sp.]|nr:MAG: hypothetical protein CUR32_00025 [Flavobacterium sp.] [Flavobacterium sp. FEMGT703F]